MRNNLNCSYRLLCLLFVIVLGCSTQSQAQIINTIAGTGTAGFSGDGGPATAAMIANPWMLAADYFGNVYLGSYYGTTSSYSRIRKIDNTGIITTCAGTGTSGFSGDGGPATAAQLSYAGGVATDAAGNLYISDWGNWRIRKVNTSGIITTVAGNGTGGYSGDGGPATAASIYNYWSIASDPIGNLYIYNWYNYRIRKIDTAGIITTIAGNGSFGVSGDGGPATAASIGSNIYGIAADAYGNVYFADFSNSRIRMINSSGIISTVAGNGATGSTGDGGPATAAQIGEPIGVAVDLAGNIIIADWNNDRVRKVNAAGIISTVAGTGTVGFSGDGGPATAAELNRPYGICVDLPGNLFIPDWYNVRVRKVTNYNRPPYFTAGPTANLVVCANSAPDSINSIVGVMDSDSYQPLFWNLLNPGSHGYFAGTWMAISTGAVVYPHGLSYTPVAGYSGPDTFRITVNDGYAFDTLTVFVTVNPTPASITGSTSLSVGGFSWLGSTPTGGTWSSSNPAIAAINATSGVATGVSAGTAVITYTLPTGCIATTTLNVFANAGQMISTIAGNGTPGFTGDGGPATAAELSGPRGVVADAAGNIYIGDFGSPNQRIRKVNSSGVISTYAGTGTAGFSGDGGAATSAMIAGAPGLSYDASGNLYLADQGNHRIRKISSSGIITTIAGNGTPGYSGDGGNATAASLYSPSGVYADGGGNVYIADYNNNCIRKINTSGIISTIAGTGVGGFSGDGAAATSAQLDHPFGVTKDVAGNLYITDYNNHRIRKISTTGIITTVGGTGTPGYGGDGSPAVTAQLNYPAGISIDAIGNLFIGDRANNRVRRINTTGVISTVGGNGTAGYGGDGCAATAGILNNPWGVSVDGGGNVFIADASNSRARKISYNHAPHFTGGHNQTTSVCENSVDSLNSLLAVSDVDNGQTETWTVFATPVHGTLVAAYTAGSTGGTITPTGLYYAPTIGYTGPDSFKVIVSDCGVGYDTTFVTVVVTLPPSSILGTPTVCPGLTTLYTDPVGSGTWSSSNTSIATVGVSTGLVTGVTSGVAVITYSPGAGCSVTRNVTVNAAPAAISGPSSVCHGQTITLTDASPGGSWSTLSSTATVGATTGIVTGVSNGMAAITYTQSGCIAIKNISINPMPGTINGSTFVCVGSAAALSDTSASGVWSSGTTGIATIDSFTGVAIGVGAGSPVISYTLPGGCYVTYTVLTVSPLPAPITGPTTVCIGGTITLTDPSGGGFWGTSLLSTSATVDPATGVVTGVSAGSSSISYTTSLGCFTSYDVTVNPTPGAITNGDSVCIGSAITLACTGGGTWSSSNPAVATIGSSTGVVTGVTAGNTTISNTNSGCSSTLSFTVNPLPAAITGPTHVCVGLTATLSDVTPGGTWSSNNIGVAPVGVTTGIFGGSSPGTATITYKLIATGCSSSTTVTVDNTPAPITGPSTVCVGSTITLADINTGGTWSSSLPGFATVGTSSGIVTGVAPSTVVVITYSIGAGCSTNKSITVNALPAAISGTASVCIGSTTSLSDVTPGGAWSSTNLPVATVISTTGVVTGVTSGISTISYIVSGCARTVVVSVNPLPAVISGPSAVCQGSNILETDATSGGVWSCTPTTVATIGTSGTVLGIAPGIATVVYTIGTGCQRSKLVTVNPLPAPISGPTQVCVGSSITLTDPSGGGIWNYPGLIATVGSTTGVVTGSSAGVATITYTIATGCIITTNVTINPLPLAISGPSAVCAGATMMLTDPGSGTWGSSAPAIANIGSSSGIVSGNTMGTTNITYTLPTGCLTTMSVTVSNAPSAISGSSTVCAGGTTTLTDAVSGGLWTSSNTTAATIGSLTGIVTGVTTGLTTIITYSLGTGCTQTKTLTVIASPAAITGVTNICMGSSVTLSDVTPSGVWSSSVPATAPVSIAGVVNGLAIGTAVISYTAAGCSAITNVTVNPAPGTIAGPSSVCTGTSITETNPVSGGTWSTSSSLITIGSSSGIINGITAGAAIITYSIAGCTTTRAITINTIGTITGATGVCVGSTTTLSCPGGGTWNSSTPSVATVGLTTGVVAGITPGTSTITYSLGTGCTASVIVTVNSGPASITGTLNVCVGSTTTLNNLVGGGTWSIAPTAYGTIGSSSGIVTGLAPGMATVTYSLGGTGCTTSAIVTVNATPAAIGGLTQVCIGSTIPLTDATTGGTWSSSNAVVAPVSIAGVVSGSSAGTATIYYTLSGCSATKPVTVNAAPPAISGPTTVCSMLLVTYSNSAPGGTWSSSNTSVAPIGSATGMVTGGSPGSATIIYTLPGGCNNTLPITVIAGPSAITGSSSVCVGHTTTLSDFTPGGVWSSDNTFVATISTTGVMTGVSFGTATISYTMGGCSATKSVSVNLPPAAISSTPDVCLLSSATWTDATTGGTWTSSNTSIATVGSASGIVTGVSAGSATIIYSMGAGCTVTAPVTIHSLPAAIAGASHVCLGMSAALSDATPGGFWSSSNSTVAPITPSGVVTGLSGGTATISYMVPSSGCAATINFPVIAVPALTNVKDMCAWGDTIHVHDADITGVYTSAMITVTNVGGGEGVVLAHIPGTGVITYTLPSGCAVSATLTVKPLPANILGNYHVCTGLTSMLSDSTSGGIWSVGTPAVATIGSTTGQVTGITSGATSVTYTLPTGCYVDTVLTVGPPPTAITGTASICAGLTSALSDSMAGGTWSSSTPSIAVVGPVTGLVSGVASGLSAITYSLGGTCFVTRTVTINPLPNVYTISGGGNYCAGGAGLHILLGNSQSGVNYQLYNGLTPVDTALHGTGSGIDFGLITGSGTYTIIATNTTTGCSANMTGTAVINANPLPTPFTVTGGGNYCSGSTGSHVGLSNSTIGVSYQLYIGVAVSGAAVAGTGAAIDFGPRTAPGTYTVVATNTFTTCTNTMTGSVVIGITPTVTPSVTLTSALGDTICAGVNDNFTTSVTNAGITPAYQWKVNGVTVGGGASSYSYTPANGDIVTVAMTSSATCAVPPTVTGTVTMTVVNLLIPSVAVSASPGTTITPGQSVTFTATVSGGGPSPAYQWEVNASPISGAVNSTYVSSTLTNGDVVTCVVTSTGQCGGQVGSGSVTMIVSDVAVPVVPGTSSDISVLPNPNKGAFTISGNIGVNINEDVTLEITDMLGQVIYKGTTMARNGKLNEYISLGNKIANGMYVLSLHSANDTRVFHIVVEQ